MTHVLIEEEIWPQIHTEEEHVKTQGEDSHLRAKERDLEKTLPSQPSTGPSPTDILISDL